MLFLYDDLKKQECAKAALYTPLGDPVPCPHCDRCIPNTPQAHTLIGTVGGQYLLKSWTGGWPAPVEHFVTRLDFLVRPIPGASQAGEITVLGSAPDGDYGAIAVNDGTTNTVRYHTYRIGANAVLAPWRQALQVAGRGQSHVSAIHSLGNAVVVGTSYSTPTTLEVEVIHHNGENFKHIPVHSEPQSSTCINPPCPPSNGVNGMFTSRVGQQEYLTVWWSEHRQLNSVHHLRFLTLDGALVRDVLLPSPAFYSLVQTSAGEWAMAVKSTNPPEMVLKILSPIDPETGAGGVETELDRVPGIGGPFALAVTKNGLVWLHNPWGSTHDAAGKMASLFEYR